MIWHSRRFDLSVRLTRHARERMAQRGVSQDEVADVVETGSVRRKDARRLWIYKAIPGRDDNLVCVAVAQEDMLIVKTIMTHWQVEEP